MQLIKIFLCTLQKLLQKQVLLFKSLRARRSVPARLQDAVKKQHQVVFRRTSPLTSPNFILYQWFSARKIYSYFF